MSMATTWGTTPDERRLAFPCDGLLQNPDSAYYRGITIEAPPAIIFRWLCQLRVAAYSYDWISHPGRRSPLELIPGLDDLEIGERRGAFELVDFERNRHLTIRASSYFILREIAVSYLIVPRTDGSCRLLVKWGARFPRGPAGWLLRLSAPWLDLIMTRKQLMNFKRLSELVARTDP